MQTPLPLRHDASLRAFNTFGIDAKARAFLQVTDIAQLAQVRADPALAALPRLVIGGGSNLLLTADFPGLVLQIGLRGITLVGRDADAVMIRAGAGESWQALVDWTLGHGFGGLENLSLIPGSVGASPIQNIGAYGAEARQFIAAVRYVDMDSGDIVTLDNAACVFGYRDSVFKHRLARNAVIVDVTFALPLPWRANLRYAELAEALAGGPAPDATTIGSAVTAIRRRKLPDPAVIGNAGSFFKNPVVGATQRDALRATWPQLVSFPQPDGGAKLAAGWLIDQCGWKGRTRGAAGVHDRQALVLVNRGGATGAEILQLAQAIQADVQARFGVALEPEPIIV